MQNFKPIKQPRISAEVFEKLKEAILLGHFRSGDKLPSERDLAGQFLVSRVAIREAIIGLENFGFVAIRQGAAGGVYVTDLTFERLENSFLDFFLAGKISIPELLQVRIFIESEVARLAALNITKESSELLVKAFENEAPKGANLEEENAKGTKVHYTLAKICGNRFFEVMVNSLVKLSSKIILTVRPDNDVIHPSGMHRPIVEAVLSGKADIAAEAMRKHTTEFGENLKKMEKEYRRQTGMIK
ncbi:MAG: FadR family transcriptional regulator [Deltaproteobacteria bacterium]|nr:FadR family transcriptional regulator [Deltaproteobacteria bacterium]